MRVLVLDDEQVRHDAFRRIYVGHEVVSVKRYSEFLQALFCSDPPQVIPAFRQWNLIHLDHDLGDHVANADTFVDGWGSTREFDGRHAAMRVIELPEALRPDAVIVHSVNSVGAVEMLGMLKRAGFSVKWEPFGEAEL